MIKELSLFLIGLLPAATVFCQKNVRAEVVIQKPGGETGDAGYYFQTFLYKNIEKTEVIATAQNGNFTTDPGYRLTNIKTGEIWELSTTKRGKIAYKAQDQMRIDSSAYYEPRYENVYKVIAGINCQKVSVRNKVTNAEDSLYISKELNHFKYRLPTKFGVPDFTVEAYEIFRGTKLVYTVTSIKKQLVPLSEFSIPKDYRIFKSEEEYSEWVKKQAN